MNSKNLLIVALTALTLSLFAQRSTDQSTAPKTEKGPIVMTQKNIYGFDFEHGKPAKTEASNKVEVKIFTSTVENCKYQFSQLLKGLTANRKIIISLESCILKEDGVHANFVYLKY